MDLAEAHNMTAEIIGFVNPDQSPPSNKCLEIHPLYKCGCEKTICTNGKHYGIVGQSPFRRAVVWGDFSNG